MPYFRFEIYVAPEVCEWNVFGQHDTLFSKPEIVQMCMPGTLQTLTNCGICTSMRIFNLICAYERHYTSLAPFCRVYLRQFGCHQGLSPPCFHRTLLAALTLIDHVILSSLDLDHHTTSCLDTTGLCLPWPTPNPHWSPLPGASLATLDQQAEAWTVSQGGG